MRFTREALHEAVWARTLHDICTEHGITYATLVGACDAMSVPRPPPQHWREVALGGSTAKVPLPVAAPGSPTALELLPRVPRPKSAPLTLPDVDRPADRPPGKQHPLVRATRAAFKEHRRVDYRGVIDLPIAALDVHVYPGEFERALALMDGLAIRLAQIGADLEVRKTRTSYDPPGTWIRFEGESIRIRLDEKTRQVRRQPTDQDRRVRLMSRDQGEVIFHEPTGVLTLRMMNLQGTRARRDWIDNAGGTLESKLDDFVQGLAAAVLAIRAHRDAQARRQRDYENERRREERHRMRAQRRGALVDQLLQMKRHWVVANSLKDFVAAASVLFPEPDRDEQVREWFELADWTVRQIDPLCCAKHARERLLNPDPATWLNDTVLGLPPDRERVRRYAAFMEGEE